MFGVGSGKAAIGRLFGRLLSWMLRCSGGMGVLKRLVNICLMWRRDGEYKYKNTFLSCLCGGKSAVTTF
jgi:hypothetical protein